MMSDSDDTDVLLLIPPDLFLVPSSSSSDVGSDRSRAQYSSKKTGVISELVEHMQSLESRISAIEYKDTSLDASFLNNSSESQIQNHPIGKISQTLPKTRFSASQSSSLQNTPVKPRRSLSVPSTPDSCSLSKRVHYNQNDTKTGNSIPVSTGANATNTNEYDKHKHDLLMSQSSVVVPSNAFDVGFPHVTTTCSDGELCPCPINYRRNTKSMHVKQTSCNQLHSMPSTSTLHSTTEQPHVHSKTSIQEMELSEVDELLQEMEATGLELSKRINRVSMHQSLKDHNSMLSNQNSISEKDYSNAYKHPSSRKLDCELRNSAQLRNSLSAAPKQKSSNVFADISLPYNDSYPMDESDNMISEFKPWVQSVQNPLSKAEEAKDVTTSLTCSASVNKLVVKSNDVQKKEAISQQGPTSTNNVHNVNSINMHNNQTHYVHKKLDVLPNELTPCSNGISKKTAEHNTLHLLERPQIPQENGNVQYITQAHNLLLSKNIAHAATNTDYFPRKSQRLLSLSDFWESNSHRTEEEIHRIKLEEEKFRREHCEHLIQELQKRLLEQQEKVAVALRVDNEKNELITQFNTAWSKLKQRLHALENEYSSLQTNLKNVSEKHQLEVSEFQSQIKRYEGELSKALDLAAGYKEKSDTETKEKIKTLKSHADELENYKSFVQEAENRYEKLKVENNKVIEKNQQTEETLKTLQQELGKERLKGGEVRNEMDVIHKALDACEAELTVLRQEKENLQLKLREENSRNAILEQKNASLLSTLDDARKAEKLAKDETKCLAEQKEKIRLELQEIYQKQVDKVVKVKLQEFQTQLDAAESEFLEELKTRQQVIAECAAKKIKDIMDKHELEINLLEEKHKEEKTLCELQLAEAVQKSSFLETQLHSQRATKSQLAEQLHSVMQKQWQQALQIISGGNMDNLTPLQKIHAEKLFEARVPRKSESMPNCYAKISQEPTKLTSHVSNTKDYRDQIESTVSTMAPLEDTPLTTKKESVNDLRKYVRMIAEMQQARDEFFKFRENISSPSLVCREVPRKHYLKKESSSRDEDSIVWQAASETTQDTSDFIPIPEKVCMKGEQQRIKPPWK